MYIIKKTLSRFLHSIKQNKTILLFIALYLLLSQIIFHSICPFAILTGLPCPACGLTRAGLCLLTGQFQQAWTLNPCIFLVVPYLLYLGFFRFVLQKKPIFVTFFSILVGFVILFVYIYRFISDTSVPILTPGILPFCSLL